MEGTQMSTAERDTVTHACDRWQNAFAANGEFGMAMIAATADAIWKFWWEPLFPVSRAERTITSIQASHFGQHKVIAIVPERRAS